MKDDNATNNIAGRKKLEEYADHSGVSMASVMRQCKLNGRNPGPYKGHYVVINSGGDMSLQTEKTVRAFD